MASGAGYPDNTVKLWRVADGVPLRTLAGHTNTVQSVKFAPDGAMLASGSTDSTMKIWRVSDGTLLKNYDQDTAPAVKTIDFSRDGQLFSYGRYDATVIVARNPYYPRPGDLNCDGYVNSGDIDSFVLALSDPQMYAQQYPGCDILNADCNADGQVNFADIDPFVALLGG